MAAAGPPAVFAFSRPAVLLLGDSITQEGSTAVGGWASALAGHFSRRADVLNRGLSGYNTRWASNVLDRCLAPHESTVLATVWYGANDAADATLNPRQHVPLDEYRKHLTNIVRRVRHPTARYSSSPGRALVLPWIDLWRHPAAMPMQRDRLLLLRVAPSSICGPKCRLQRQLLRAQVTSLGVVFSMTACTCPRRVTSWCFARHHLRRRGRIMS
mmetsp:Transcript_93609/g.244182  ORF Transcript_93609/g.244182 Transcript_93609/m.244182 type:complete len:214 (+) Transcript_93609:56-697(+)